MNLEGCSAVVTGGARGIGAAIARLFAQAWMIRYVFYLLAFTCFTRTEVQVKH